MLRLDLLLLLDLYISLESSWLSWPGPPESPDAAGTRSQVGYDENAMLFGLSITRRFLSLRKTTLVVILEAIDATVPAMWEELETGEGISGEKGGEETTGEDTEEAGELMEDGSGDVIPFLVGDLLGELDELSLRDIGDSDSIDKLPQ